jgi:integrase
VTKLQDVGIGTRPSPAKTPLVRLMMRGLSKAQGKDVRQKHPLSLQDLERMIAGEPDTLRGLRNRAMYVIGWGAALRAGEVLSLDVKKGNASNGWIEWSSNGLVVHLLRSKSNQAGRRHECYGIPARPKKPRYCPVRILARWLSASRIKAGPLFRNIGMGQSIKPSRLGFQGLYRAMRYRAVKVGLPPDTVSSGSLRAGCITWLFHQGVAPSRILTHSGHASIATMLPYLRMDGDPRNSPLHRTKWVR